MATRADLIAELLKLPAAQRAEAARTLLQSLDGDDADGDVAAIWREEIASRVAEIEDGSVDLEDGPAAMRGLRARAQARFDRSKQ